MKRLMTGNEAIARGAWEAGVKLVSAYPGTPSTEITENAAKYPEIYVEWAPNEKVALEVGAGAAIGGGRAMVTMKHVGLNVAADPLFTASYTGVSGGLVVVSADDPDMHSSQNEQDNRNYGKAAKLPMLEPADSQEAKDFAKLAFRLSEEYDTPVLLRITTRVAHSQSLVELEEREERQPAPYVRDIDKYVMVPANARKRHVLVEERMRKLLDFSNESEINRIEPGNTGIGVIAAGVVYQYVKEALPHASVLKLGMLNPLPEAKIREFAASVGRLFVIEELDPYIEEAVRAMGIRVAGKELFSLCGEIFAPEIRQRILGVEPAPDKADADVPVRPPVMCPGCPHRGIFYVLRQLKAVVSGDIGCYTLAHAEPLAAMDACICMGASIGMAHGLSKVQGPEFGRKVVSVLGDSTFMHSGLTGLVNVAYNKGNTITIILDNSITAMTGHQQNPTTGLNAKGEAALKIDLESICRGCGIERIHVLDPFDLKECRRVLKEEMASDEPSVIITRRPCMLIDKKGVKPPYHIDADACNDCHLCLGLGCPCLGVDAAGHVRIDAAQCVGCGLCAELCAHNAIKKVGE